MKALVEHIAGALVDNPDQVNVVESENGDMINKQGRTARAMRSILSAAAAQDNKKSRLDILE